MQIYEMIFNKLEEKGISQKELSQATGIRQSTISDWKNKKVNPSADRILVISKALGISPVDLLGGGDLEQFDYVAVDKETGENVLIENFRSLTPDKKDMLLKYMEKLKQSNE